MLHLRSSRNAPSASKWLRITEEVKSWSTLLRNHSNPLFCPAEMPSAHSLQGDGKGGGSAFFHRERACVIFKASTPFQPPTSNANAPAFSNSATSLSCHFPVATLTVIDRNMRAHDSPRGAGDNIVYVCDPTRPIGRWKQAWESAKTRAGVSCRFQDLRHTGCTWMLEMGVPFSVVATIMGWSPSTTVRMARRHGHIMRTAQRQAVNALNQASIQDDGAQNWAQSQMPPLRQLAN
jgi:hypothetical protein